jgi:hypothetical protein
MYIQPTTTYGSLIPGSENIRSLVRQGTISEAAARRQAEVLASYPGHGRCDSLYPPPRHLTTV